MHSPSKARFRVRVSKLKMKFLLFASSQLNSIETINYAVVLQLFTQFIKTTILNLTSREGRSVCSGAPMDLSTEISQCQDVQKSQAYMVTSHALYWRHNRRWWWWARAERGGVTYYVGGSADINGARGRRRLNFIFRRSSRERRRRGEGPSGPGELGPGGHFENWTRRSSRD